MNIYAIWDSVSLSYNVPFFVVNEAVAVRSCRFLVRDESTMVSHCPADYFLHYLGSIDLVSGVITPVEKPVPVVNLNVLAIEYEKELMERERLEKGKV